MSRTLFLLLLFTTTFCLAGCSQTTPATQNTLDKATIVASLPTATDASISVSPPPFDTGSRDTECMSLTVYQAAKDGLSLVPEIRVVAKNDNPAQTAMSLLAAGPKSHSLLPVMPTGVKLHGLLIKDQIAYVNFNTNLVNNQPGGSSQERLLVAAIVNTLTEFSSIEQVQILIDNQPRATLAGHVDISVPLSRSEGIIKR